MYTVEEERELLLDLARGQRNRAGRWAAPQLPGLHPGDFELPAHRLIWRALVGLAYLRLGVTPRAVAEQVAQMGQGEAVCQAVSMLEQGVKIET